MEEKYEKIRDLNDKKIQLKCSETQRKIEVMYLTLFNLLLIHHVMNNDKGEVYMYTTSSTFPFYCARLRQRRSFRSCLFLSSLLSFRQHGWQSETRVCSRTSQYFWYYGCSGYRSNLQANNLYLLEGSDEMPCTCNESSLASGARPEASVWSSWVSVTIPLSVSVMLLGISVKMLPTRGI